MSSRGPNPWRVSHTSALMERIQMFGFQLTQHTLIRNLCALALVGGAIASPSLRASSQTHTDAVLGVAYFGSAEGTEELLKSELATGRRRGEIEFPEFVERVEALGYVALNRDGYWILIEESVIQVNQLLVVSGILEKFFNASPAGVRLQDMSDAEFGYIASLTGSTPELQSIVRDGNAVVSVGLVSNYQLSRDNQSAWFSAVHMPSQRDLDIEPSPQRSEPPQSSKQVEKWDIRLVEEIAAKDQLSSWRIYSDLVADYVEAKQAELDVALARVQESANEVFAARALGDANIRAGQPLPPHLQKSLENGDYINYSNLSSQERLEMLAGGLLTTGFLEISIMVNPMTDTGMPNHAYYVPGMRIRLNISD